MLAPLSKRVLLETKTSWFTCLELCPEISNVSSQLELLETLYLPLSKEGGQPRRTAASSWQLPTTLSASIHGKHERAEKEEKNRRGKRKGKKCVMKILKIQSRGNGNIKIRRSI